jgi:hypothetical protein
MEFRQFGERHKPHNRRPTLHDPYIDSSDNPKSSCALANWYPGVDSFCVEFLRKYTTRWITP